MCAVAHSVRLIKIGMKRASGSISLLMIFLLPDCSFVLRKSPVSKLTAKHRPLEEDTKRCKVLKIVWTFKDLPSLPDDVAGCSAIAYDAMNGSISIALALRA